MTGENPKPKTTAAVEYVTLRDARAIIKSAVPRETIRPLPMIQPFCPVRDILYRRAGIGW